MTGPTHLTNEAGERWSLCGIKKALPSMCAFAVPFHRANYDLELCPTCEALIPETPWKPSWLTEEESVA